MSPVPGGTLFPGDDAGTGGRTLADLRSEVLGNDFDSAAYSTRATQYLNEALRRVDRQLRLPTREGTQTYATTSGAGTLALPSLRARVVSLRNTDDRDPLVNVDIAAIDDATSALGKPTSYALVAGQVVLYPTPDGVYNLELRYRATGAAFAADTDTTGQVGFPDDWASILVAYARWRLYLAEDDAGMAQVWGGEWARMLGEMKADIQFQGEDEVRQVPSMWDVGAPASLSWRG